MAKRSKDIFGRGKSIHDQVGKEQKQAMYSLIRNMVTGSVLFFLLQDVFPKLSSKIVQKAYML